MHYGTRGSKQLNLILFLLILISSFLWTIRRYSFIDVFVINSFVSLGLICGYLCSKSINKSCSKNAELAEYTVKHSINSVAILDRNLNYIIVSEKYALSADLKSNDIIGKHFSDVFPEQYDRFKNILNGSTFIEKDIIYEDFYTADKSFCKYIRVVVSPLKSETGDIEGLMIFNNLLNSDKDYEKFKFLSFHDILTGLYNRAFFEEEIKRLSKSRELPICIIMGDVNGLKLTNDAFGHKEGDNFLRIIANILKASCRDEDIVARIGGDEFAIILTKTHIEDTLKICDRIRMRCAASVDNIIQPSISLGFAAKYDPSQNIDSILREAETMMYENKFQEGKALRQCILNSLKNYLDRRTSENNDHLDRVRKMSVELAHRIGLSEKDTEELSNLALLHDIGKVAIPENILEKSGSLSNDEWKLMRNHCETGYRIASTITEIASIADNILYHHEHWDGSGYPLGLKRDEIPLLARIISVVDAYDVMVHGRPYQKAVTKEQAIDEIRRCSGTQFDPCISEMFVNMIYNRYKVL